MINFYKVLLLLAFTFQISACSAGTLKSDEDVWFFPTSANQVSAHEWNIPVHHWVFEKEEKSITRKITQKFLSEAIESLGVSEEQSQSPRVRQRLMWFLVDNQRNKKIQISLQGTTVALSKTAPNGHANTQIKYLGDAKAGEWINYKVIDPVSPARHFTGQVQMIPQQGLSIISDIDDTIKHSNVLDKKELIKNTFVKPYQTTQGMPAYYQTLKKQGAYFHYVSASPWQLQPSLKNFMNENYPQGTVSLRKFRLKDSSILKFLQPSTEYKTAQIKSILERYPNHQFILIGDSGEHDPEVYATIYQQFPKQIKAIQIRAVEGSDLSEQRFAKTFQLLPKSIWHVFTQPSLMR